MDTKHDYRCDKELPGATLVVRASNRYGAAGPGERVLVDESELQLASTLTSCMLEADYEKLLADREVRATAVKKLPPIVAIVEQGLARIREQAEAKAKARAAAEALAPPGAPEAQPPGAAARRAAREAKRAKKG